MFVCIFVFVYLRLFVFVYYSIHEFYIEFAPVESLAEDHSIEGSIEDHSHSHQVLLALHLVTWRFAMWLYRLNLEMWAIKNFGRFLIR